jgi:hypothetical protein
MEIENLIDDNIFKFFKDTNLDLYNFLSNYYYKQEELGKYFNLQNIKYNKWGDYKIEENSSEYTGKFNVNLTLFFTNVCSLEIINLFHNKLKNFKNMYEMTVTNSTTKNSLFSSKNIKLNIYCSFNEYKISKLTEFYSKRVDFFPENIFINLIKLSLEYKNIISDLNINDIFFINIQEERNLLGLIKIENDNYGEKLKNYNNVFGDIGIISIDNPHNIYKLKIGNYNYVKIKY